MATSIYTGKLSDFGEAPFLTAKPELWVAPHGDAFGSSGGVHAARKIPIQLRLDGGFEVRLVPSADLTPFTRYSLRCDWLDVNGISQGWAQLDFTAAIGGGAISDMTDLDLTRVWVGEEAPPLQRTKIYWLHPVTGDVREWVS